MGTELTSWEAQMAESAQEVAAAAEGSGGGSFFSLQGGVLSYGGNAVPGNAMNVVVVAHSYGSQFYASDYQPGSKEAPSCIMFTDVYEEASRTGGAPSDESPDRQALTCADCDKFAWGSGKYGRGKACKMFARLALLPADALTSPDDIETAEIALLKVPTTSVANFNEFVRALSENLSRPPWAVVTTVSVKPDAKTQFKVHFKPVSKLPEQVGRAVSAKRDRYMKTNALHFVGVPSEETASKIK